MLEKHDVNVCTNTALKEVGKDHFIVEHEGVQKTMNFDYGFVCLGMRAYAPHLQELIDTFTQENVEVVNIGDSVRARKIIEGIEEGRNILTVLKRHDFL